MRYLYPLRSDVTMFVAILSSILPAFVGRPSTCALQGALTSTLTADFRRPHSPILLLMPLVVTVGSIFDLLSHRRHQGAFHSHTTYFGEVSLVCQISAITDPYIVMVSYVLGGVDNRYHLQDANTSSVITRLLPYSHSLSTSP